MGGSSQGSFCVDMRTQAVALVGGAQENPNGIPHGNPKKLQKWYCSDLWFPAGYRKKGRGSNLKKKAGPQIAIYSQCDAAAWRGAARRGREVARGLFLKPPSRGSGGGGGCPSLRFVSQPPRGGVRAGGWPECCFQPAGGGGG